MKKIPTLFHRDPATHLVYDEVNAGTKWVMSGEGVATEKVDGTCCLVRDGNLFKRYELKKGKTTAPTGFKPCQNPDPVTGDVPGWVPVSDTDPQDKWYREALVNMSTNLPDGTYELLGPKVQGNKHYLGRHVLWLHGAPLTLKEGVLSVPMDFSGLRQWFTDHPTIEGIVWHHPDGRMAKIKRKDFGLPWPVKP